MEQKEPAEKKSFRAAEVKAGLDALATPIANYLARYLPRLQPWTVHVQKDGTAVATSRPVSLEEIYDIARGDVGTAPPAGGQLSLDSKTLGEHVGGGTITDAVSRAIVARLWGKQQATDADVQRARKETKDAGAGDLLGDLFAAVAPGHGLLDRYVSANLPLANPKLWPVRVEVSVGATGSFERHRGEEDKKRTGRKRKASEMGLVLGRQEVHLVLTAPAVATVMAESRSAATCLQTLLLELRSLTSSDWREAGEASHPVSGAVLLVYEPGDDRRVLWHYATVPTSLSQWTKTECGRPFGTILSSEGVAADFCDETRRLWSNRMVTARLVASLGRRRGLLGSVEKRAKTKTVGLVAKSAGIEERKATWNQLPSTILEDRYVRWVSAPEWTKGGLAQFVAPSQPPPEGSYDVTLIKDGEGAYGFVVAFAVPGNPGLVYSTSDKLGPMLARSAQPDGLTTLGLDSHKLTITDPTGSWLRSQLSGMDPTDEIQSKHRLPVFELVPRACEEGEDRVYDIRFPSSRATAPSSSSTGTNPAFLGPNNAVSPGFASPSPSSSSSSSSSAAASVPGAAAALAEPCTICGA